MFFFLDFEKKKNTIQKTPFLPVLIPQKMNTVKQRINQVIIDELENGDVPRKKTRNTIQIGSNDRPYTGINQLILQISKTKNAYGLNRRMTFSQIKKMGGQVKK